MPNETKVTASVVKKLNSVIACRAKKRHSGRYGSGDPDVSGVYRGNAFFVEMKKLDGAITELQADELQKWSDAGAETFVGIYDDATRRLALIDLAASETWRDFANKSGVRELWDSSVTQRAKVSEYDFQSWLDNRVAHEPEYAEN